MLGLKNLGEHGMEIGTKVAGTPDMLRLAAFCALYLVAIPIK